MAIIIKDVHTDTMLQLFGNVGNLYIIYIRFKIIHCLFIIKRKEMVFKFNGV